MCTDFGSCQLSRNRKRSMEVGFVLSTSGWVYVQFWLELNNILTMTANSIMQLPCKEPLYFHLLFIINATPEDVERNWPPPNSSNLESTSIARLPVAARPFGGLVLVDRSAQGLQSQGARAVLFVPLVDKHVLIEMSKSIAGG